MFIGRYFVPRRIAILVGAVLSVVLIAGGAFAFQATKTALSANPAPTVAPLPVPSSPTPGEGSTAPSPAGPSSIESPNAPASGSPAPSSCTGTDCPTASPEPTSSDTGELVTEPPAPDVEVYEPDTEVISVIELANFEGETPQVRAFAAAETVWRQVLLLAQTNARPNRVLEGDLDIIGARLIGATWETKENKVVYASDGETVTVYICLPYGPSTTACKAAPA